MTIAPSMDNVGKCLFQLFVAGEIQGMSRACPCGCDVQSTHGSPDPFSPHDPPQGLQHIPVASSRFRLQALHPCLPAQGGEQVRYAKGLSLVSAPHPALPTQVTPSFQSHSAAFDGCTQMSARRQPLQVSADHQGGFPPVRTLPSVQHHHLTPSSQPHD